MLRATPKLRSLPSRPFAVVLVVGILLCVVFSASVAVSPDRDINALITTFFLVTFGSFAAASAVRRMRKTSSGRRRKAWFTVSVGLCLGVLANAIGLLLTVAGMSEWLFVVDAMLVSALVVCMIALTLFRPRPAAVWTSHGSSWTGWLSAGRPCSWPA